MGHKPWRKPISDFSWSFLPNGTLHIIDHNLGGMSVTNDAENVLGAIDGALRAEYGKTLNEIEKITYQDSEGQVDGLYWSEDEFKGFVPGS